jgi:excisionase family DNA binding protein
MKNQTSSKNVPEQYRHLQDLTISQASQVLQVSQTTIWWLVKKGMLHKYNVGRSARIHIESVTKLRGGFDAKS